MENFNEDSEDIFTVKGQLDLIEDNNIREKALQNMINEAERRYNEYGTKVEETFFHRVSSISYALLVAFVWSDTEEGNAYWLKVYEGYKE